MVANHGKPSYSTNFNNFNPHAWTPPTLPCWEKPVCPCQVAPSRDCAIQVSHHGGRAPVASAEPFEQRPFPALRKLVKSYSWIHWKHEISAFPPDISALYCSNILLLVNIKNIYIYKTLWLYNYKIAINNSNPSGCSTSRSHPSEPRHWSRWRRSLAAAALRWSRRRPPEAQHLVGGLKHWRDG